MKGLDLLAEAFGQLVRNYPEARQVIVGSEDEGFGARVRPLLTDLGVLDRARFTGMDQGADKLAALVDADVFVLPQYSENFSITILEAMACGTPVVASNAGPFPEVMGPLNTTCAPDDVAGFSALNQKIFGNGGYRADLIQKGFDQSSRFTWEGTAKKVIKEYCYMLDA